jgi:hypothetical protein
LNDYRIFYFSRYLFRKIPVEIQPSLELEPELNFRLKGIEAYFPKNPVYAKSRRRYGVETRNFEKSRFSKFADFNWPDNPG